MEKIYNQMEVWIMDKLVMQDRPVDGTFESYVYAARFFPSVWLKPIEP